MLHSLPSQSNLGIRILSATDEANQQIKAQIMELHITRWIRSDNTSF